MTSRLGRLACGTPQCYHPQNRKWLSVRKTINFQIHIRKNHLFSWGSQEKCNFLSRETLKIATFRLLHPGAVWWWVATAGPPWSWTTDRCHPGPVARTQHVDARTCPVHGSYLLEGVCLDTTYFAYLYIWKKTIVYELLKENKFMNILFLKSITVLRTRHGQLGVLNALANPWYFDRTDLESTIWSPRLHQFPKGSDASCESPKQFATLWICHWDSWRKLISKIIPIVSMVNGVQWLWLMIVITISLRFLLYLSIVFNDYSSWWFPDGQWLYNG